MESQAPCHVSYIAEGVSCQNPLEAAMRATLTRAQRRAQAAGYADVRLEACLTLRGGELCFKYTLLATPAGRSWHQAIMVESASLELAELAFDEALTQAELSAYEADPSRYVDAQIESYQQLQAAA